MNDVYLLPKLTEWQREVAESLARFKVVAGGRRLGKSMLGSVLASKEAAAGGRVMWASPSYRQTEEGLRYVARLASQLPDCVVREADRSVRFPSGGEVVFRSSDDADLLRGSAIDFLVADECALIAPTVWHVLRPSLADRRGAGLFISTPRGPGDWFHGLFLAGQDESQSEWRSWQFPSRSNPYLDPGELAAIKASLPERVFEQEHEAEFLADEGAIFRRVRESSIGDIETPGRGPYAGFCDLASVGRDFCGLSVVKIESGRYIQCFADRWSGGSFELTIERIAAAARRYPGNWSLDLTGQLYDEPYVEALRKRGVTIEGLKFTNELKRRMVFFAVGALERGDLVLLSPDVNAAARAQLGEMLAFTAERLPSGMLRFAAPPGGFDDMAISVVASVWTAHEAGDPAEIAAGFRLIRRKFRGTLA